LSAPQARGKTLKRKRAGGGGDRLRTKAPLREGKSKRGVGAGQENWRWKIQKHDCWGPGRGWRGNDLLAKSRHPRRPKTGEVYGRSRGVRCPEIEKSFCPACQAKEKGEKKFSWEKKGVVRGRFRALLNIPGRLKKDIKFLGKMGKRGKGGGDNGINRNMHVDGDAN